MAEPSADIAATLAELADEHLERMSKVPWDSYARAIRERAPRTAGETFGCEIDDRYYDVGDIESWAGEPDGDIQLVAHATTGEGANRHRVERSTIVRRKS